MANNEKITGPHRGLVGVGSVVLLTVATWGFLWYLHTTMYHDPIDPMSPNERSTVTQAETAHQQQTADTPHR